MVNIRDLGAERLRGRRPPAAHAALTPLVVIADSDDGDGPVVRWGRASWNVVGVVIAIYLAAIGVGRLKLVVVPILVAILISTQLAPIARFLERHGWPRLLAAWAAFLVLIGGLAGLVYLVAPAVSSEFGNLGTTLGDSGQRIKHWLTTGPLKLSPKRVDDFSTSFTSQISGNQDRILHGVVSTAPIVLEVVAAIIVTFVLTFFFIKDGAAIVDRLVGMVRSRRRAGIRRFLDNSWLILTGYVRGSAINGVVNAVVLSTALAVLGVPLIIPIAVITVLGSFIPLVGGVVSGGIAAAVAFVEKGPTAALIMIGVTILIHHLEGYIVGPLVMGRAVHLHPAAVIVGISAGTIAFGILGAFVAVPAVAIITAAIDTANADADAARTTSTRGSPVSRPSGEQFEIRHGDQRATIVEVGGGVRAYSVGGRNVLDPYPVDAECDGAHGAVLVPWPNRLADGRYCFDGVDHQVPITEPAKANAIHGLLRWRSWSAIEHTPERVVMATTLHPMTGYPFTLHVTVAYELGDTGLTVTTSATNAGTSVLPYGCGQHPYLSPGRGLIDDCTLQFAATTRIVTDPERQLPIGTEAVAGTAFDFARPRPIGDLQIDFAFADLERDIDGRAMVRLTGVDGGCVELWVDEHFPIVELYTGDTLRPGRRRRGLGVEPMTCPPNAFQSGDALIRIDPGATVTTSWGVGLTL